MPPQGDRLKNRPSILIVDDRLPNLLALEVTLSALDVEVVRALSGNEALAATLEHDFVLAIVDVQMPGMDGFELAELIHGEDRTRRLPIIFLTAAYGSDEKVFEGYGVGAVDYLIKPYNEMILLAKARVFMDLDAERRELEERRRALEAVVEVRSRDLRSAEEQFLGLFERSEDAIMTMEVHSGAFTSGNLAALKMFGASSVSEFKSWTPLRLSPTLQPDGRSSAEKLAELVSTALHAGSNHFDWTLRRIDGTEFFSTIVLTPIHVGEKRFVQAIIRDVTVQRQSEEHERLARVTLELLNRLDGPEDPIRGILTAIQQSTGVDAVGIRLREGEDFPYYATEGFPENFVAAEGSLCSHDSAGQVTRDAAGSPMLACLCGLVLSGYAAGGDPWFTEKGSFWTNGTSHLIASTGSGSLPPSTRHTCNRMGYESMALIPLHVGTDLIGLLQLNDHRPNRFTPDTIRFFEGLGESIGVALSRKRTRVALQESEEKFRSIAENLSDVIFVADPAGRLTYVSPSSTSIFGIDPSAMEGHAAAEFLSPGAGPASQYDAFCSGAPVRDLVLSARRHNGEPFVAEVSSRQLQRDGQPPGTIGVIRDVTERFQRERELGVVATLSATLRAAPSRKEMLPILLDEITLLLGGAGASIGTVEPESGDIVLELANGALSPLQGVRLAGRTSLSADVIASGLPVVSDDIRTDARVLHPEVFRDAPAFLAMPLISQDVTFGVLAIARKSPFSHRDARLANAVADIGASALRRASLHEQTLKQLQQMTSLRTIDESIAGSLELGQVLRVIIDEVITESKADAVSVLLLNPHDLTLECTAGRGFHPGSREKTRLPLGEGLAGRAASQRRLLGATDLGAGTKRSRSVADGFVSHHVAPLLSAGQVLGVLEVFHREAFNPDAEWMGFFGELASQTAIAIHRAAMFEDVQRSNLSLRLAYDATIDGWARALDLRDKETEGHSRRVTVLTVEVGRALGIPDETLVHVRRGALLHDIGKLGIPDAILLKPGPLTEEEWVVMRSHPQLAFDMLLPIEHLRPALDIPFCHHERWDGSGYPRGLRGEAIPLGARIFAVVDVWDALTNDRPYRKAWTRERAMTYIHEQAGTHFDPDVLPAFVDALGRELEEAPDRPARSRDQGVDTTSN